MSLQQPPTPQWNWRQLGGWVLGLCIPLILIAALFSSMGFASPAPPSTKRPLIIGHRGSSGDRPEHTMASYLRAIEVGADFIEPDLVCTKDGVLVARHENEIGETTDAALKFPSKKTEKIVDGEKIEGWFIEDLTLEEVRQLRAKERLPFRDQSRNGQEAIPTFEEILQLRESESKRLGREIGIYPEVKHPSYFRSIGCKIEAKLVEQLEKAGLDRADAPVFIQSFEWGSLLRLNFLAKPPLVQLVDDRPLSDLKLFLIHLYADGIGPNKNSIVPVVDGKAQEPTDLVERSHKAKLFVHPWTFRSDKEFLAASYEGDPKKEFDRFRELGVDGVFTDFPADAVKAWSN